MLAMRHPELFSVACSHSGALFFTHTAHHKRPEVQAFAEAVGPTKYNCFALARKLKRSKRHLSIRIDCGTEDGLIEAIASFMHT